MLLTVHLHRNSNAPLPREYHAHNTYGSVLIPTEDLVLAALGQNILSLP